MFPIPYRKTRIVSPHSPEVVAERLRLHSVRRWPWFRSPVGKFDFVGSISLDAFRLIPSAPGRDTYQPWVRGRMTARPDGTEIKVVQTLHPIGVLIIVGVLALGFYLARRYGDYRDIIIALFVLHCLLYFTAFWWRARRAEERIRELAA
jgi:hypothetical protein